SAKKTLLIGEPVFAASLRWLLDQEEPDADVRILCPLEDPCGSLRGTDLITTHEREMKAALAKADRVIADPLYRNLLPGKDASPAAFVDWPSENYSGRLYRDRIPVFLGPQFSLK
ncbi:MAG: hypothetical protein ILO43_08150, partial [Clostridia bacterium]|nr:hypothetical protein [Clostridia bacterium]